MLQLAVIRSCRTGATGCSGTSHPAATSVVSQRLWLLCCAGPATKWPLLPLPKLLPLPLLLRRPQLPPQPLLARQPLLQRSQILPLSLQRFRRA